MENENLFLFDAELTDIITFSQAAANPMPAEVIDLTLDSPPESPINSPSIPVFNSQSSEDTILPPPLQKAPYNDNSFMLTLKPEAPKPINPQHGFVYLEFGTTYVRADRFLHEDDFDNIPLSHWNKWSHDGAVATVIIPENNQSTRVSQEPGPHAFEFTYFPDRPHVPENTPFSVFP